ncbi:efflux RND transporter permease subunit [Pseudoalteromonas luteoviolacea]|uniref:efflux RND transporter permease subunit n=1 Tax=Pseudoalteromonas luteoviolacea TaxID=43657 RepID=UPI00115342C6|nr:MMPL family transporter [Pseudoalteromonas luteoviolacea]TQF66174.1 MMPL family transporter [Pseudoalteromonas luteoviolacea]
MTKSVSQHLIKWRYALSIIVLIGVYFLHGGSKYISFSQDYQDWFHKDNPQLKSHLNIQRTYEKSDNVTFLLTPKDGNIFTRESLASLEWLTEQAWQMPASTRVNSLINFQHTSAIGDDLLVEELVQEAAQLSDSELKLVEKIALSEPAIKDLLVSSDGRVAAVTVTINITPDTPGGNPGVTAFARDLISQLKKINPNIDMHLTGLTVMDTAFIEASAKDMDNLTPLMFAVIILGLLLLLRSFFATASICVIVVLSIMSAMGFSGWINIPLTAPSATSPTIIMTIAVANSVHIVLAYLRSLSQDRAKIEAMMEALSANLQPVALANLTTIIGFLTMHFSDIAPFHHLGNMIAMGVFVSFLLSFTVLPVLLILLPIKARKLSENGGFFAKKLSEFVIDRRRLLLPVLLITSGILSAGLLNNQMNEVISAYFDKSTLFRQHTDYASEHLTGPYYLEFSVDSGIEGGISEPRFLNQLDKFSNWLKNQPEVVHVLSLSDTMKRLNKNLNGDDPNEYKLPVEQSQASQYLLLYDMSLPYGMDMSNQVNIKKSATRIFVSLHNLSTQQMLGLTERTSDWFSSNTSGLTLHFSSPTYMFSNIASRAVDRMAISVLVAMTLIGFFITIALKSLKMGLLSLIPNTLPPAVAFGLWGYFNGEVSFAMAIGVTVAIGIIVDDTVHFLSKYMYGRKEKGLSPENSIRYAFEQVSSALIVTSIVLTAGFLVLATSTFKLNFELGIITAASINAALILDFLLLPLLLLMFDREKSSATDLPTTSFRVQKN